MCGSVKREDVVVLLQLSETMPPDGEIERWLGEPVKALALPASIFIRNRKGFPVLPKAQQELVGRFLQLGVQARDIPGPAELDVLSPYGLPL